MSDSPQVPDPAPGLRPLQQSVLDPETLAALFSDIACFTQVKTIIPKVSPGVICGQDSITLEEARQGLADGRFRGVQVRYEYEGKEWCDTLLSTATGVRLVRVCDER